MSACHDDTQKRPGNHRHRCDRSRNRLWRSVFRRPDRHMAACPQPERVNDDRPPTAVPGHSPPLLPPPAISSERPVLMRQHAGRRLPTVAVAEHRDTDQAHLLPASCAASRQHREVCA
jgi:hypothetical protein